MAQRPCLVLIEWEATGKHINLSHLAEFQTPTIFNCEFDLHCSILYRSLKILKIVNYILYIHKNVSIILICMNLNCEFGYVVISFQSYKISIYINNSSRF